MILPSIRAVIRPACRMFSAKASGAECGVGENNRFANVKSITARCHKVDGGNPVCFDGVPHVHGRAVGFADALAPAAGGRAGVIGKSQAGRLDAFTTVTHGLFQQRLDPGAGPAQDRNFRRLLNDSLYPRDLSTCDFIL